MVLNLLVIVLTLSITSVVLYFLKIFLEEKFFPWAEDFSDLLARKLEWKFSIICLEVVFFLFTIVVFMLMLTNLKYQKYIILMFYGLYISLSGLTIRKIKNSNPNSISIIYRIKQRIDMNNYFTNRLVGLFRQLGQSFFPLVIISMIGTFVFLMSWPIIVYFIGFMVVPLITVFWTYFPYFCKLGKNKDFVNSDNKIVNTRKIMIYTLPFLYAFLRAYVIFQEGIGIEVQFFSQEYDVIITIISIVFFAFDRLVNLIMKDYEEFKN